MSIETERLILRAWEDRDRQPFAAMCHDAAGHAVPLAFGDDPGIGRVDRAARTAHHAEHGFCFWAVEERVSEAFVGAIGLLRVGYQAHFTPAVEVGWRIARPFWGKGYAPEAAWASICFGFATLGLSEIVANAAVANDKSRRVMEKLGMRRDPADDFDHPRVPPRDRAPATGALPSVTRLLAAPGRVSPRRRSGLKQHRAQPP